jgi:hypothetical protein
MADYYSILKKTIASLPESNGAARRSVYSRARNAIVNQLKAYEPPLSPSEITAEQLRLEEAIRKVEAEAARESLGLEPSSPPPSPAPTVSAPQPSQTLAASASASETEPAVHSPAPAAPAEETITPSLSEPPVAPEVSAPAAAGASLAGEGIQPEPAAAADFEPQRFELAVDTTESEKASIFEDETGPPATTTAGLSESGAAIRQGRDKPSAVEALRTSDGKSRLVPIAAAAAAAIIVLIGAVYFLLPGSPDKPSREASAPAGERQETASVSETTPEPQTPRAPAVPVKEATAPEPDNETGKNTDRLLNETDDGVVAPDARTVTTTTISPQPAAPAAPSQPSIVTNVESTPAEEQASPESESPVAVGTPVPQDSLAAVTPPQAEQTPAGAAADTGAQRSILYEEGTDASAAGTAAQGAVIWSLGQETDLSGQAQSVLSASVEIPERDVKVDIRIKPNDDTSLPASHLVEIKYELPENFSAGDIVNVPGLVMKPTEEARGDALIGASVKVSPGFFWIALSSLPNEQQRNMALLRERGWIDIPMLYENGKRGILTLEKGATGADAVEKAVTAWQAG